MPVHARRLPCWALLRQPCITCWRHSVHQMMHRCLPTFACSILHRTKPDHPGIMAEIETFRAEPLQPACDDWCALRILLSWQGSNMLLDAV